MIPKHHQANKWRFIKDLSHPDGFSINDDIPSHLCSLLYITVDNAIQKNIVDWASNLAGKGGYKKCFLLTPRASC